MDHYEQIKNSYSEIEAGIRALIRFILKSEIKSCTVFSYPRVQKNNEHEEYTHIPVSRITGSEAISKTLTALGQFRGETLASTKSVFRLPGVISILTDEPEKLIALLCSINESKARFCEVANQIPADDRFDVIHTVIPRLIYLQLTRNLNWENGSLQSVNFTWGASSSIIKITREEIQERIANLLSEDKISYTQARSDLGEIQSLPKSAELRIKRKVKIRPLINLNRGLGQKQRYARKEGHLPLIVINSPEFKTGQLKDYDSSVQRKKRGDTTIGDEPIISSVKVFLSNQK